MFMNLAHRGASSYAPENTLAAFYKAIEVGANGIETDIKVTKDGKLFLFHDDLLDRTTNGKGSPIEKGWDQLENLDAGSWYSSKYKGEKLVTLEQFLYFFGSKDLIFALELKDRLIEHKVLEFIQHYDLFDQTTITSFDFKNLIEVRKLDTNIKIGYLIPKIDLATIEKFKNIGGNQICPQARHLTKDDVQLAREYQLEVRAWGVANEKLMCHAFECGVDGMTVNFPDKLANLIGTKGISGRY
jgi:glycerophosphoryl diester phosphodiesterase